MSIHPNYPVSGLDLSKWQVFTDPQKAKAKGVEFVIIRAGNGVRQDIRMIEHRNMCEAYDIPTLFYWYYQPTSTTKDIATAIKRTVRPKDYVFIDMEKNKVDIWPTNATPTIITEHVLRLLDECDQMLGQNVGIYTSQNWWNAWILRTRIPKFKLNTRRLWVAQWFYSLRPNPTRLPNGWNDWDVWQFSGTVGPYSGKAKEFGVSFSHSVDVNAFKGTVDEFNRSFRGKRNDIVETTFKEDV